MSNPAEQRKYEHVAVTLPARFGVLIPEHTFQPMEYECEVIDLSERGAMINVKLPAENYSMMLQKTRYCRLGFENLKVCRSALQGELSGFNHRAMISCVLIALVCF